MTIAERVSAGRAFHALDPALAAVNLLIGSALLERRIRAELQLARFGDPPVDLDFDLARLLIVIGSERRTMLRQCDLVELLGLSRTSVSRLIDRADATGFVDRVYLEACDGRATWCRLTPRGNEARRRTQLMFRRAGRETFRGSSGDLARPLAAIRAAWHPRAGGYGYRWYMGRRPAA